MTNPGTNTSIAPSGIEEGLDDDVNIDNVPGPTAAGISPAVREALLSLQNGFSLVAAWNRSLRALRQHMKRLPISQLKWKLIHIAPINPHRLPGPDLTCKELLKRYIPGGGTEEDDDWLALLGEGWQDSSRKTVAIHCEAALMALACSPSGEAAKTAGLEEVFVCFDLYFQSLVNQSGLGYETHAQHHCYIEEMLLSLFSSR